MKVTIIGAGFSGSVLALSLKKARPPIDCIIYEASSKDTPVTGNVTLTANALRVLDAVGIYNEIRLQGYACERISLVDSQDNLLGSLYNGDVRNHGYQALRISRQSVKDALGRQLEAQGVKVVYEMPCSKVEELLEINKVNLSFPNGKVVTADYVVGADGVHSMVRKRLEKGSEARYQGSLNLSASVSKSKLPAGFGNFKPPCIVYGGRGMISFIPTDLEGEDVGVFATAEYQDLGDKGFELISREKHKLKVILGRVYCVGEWPKVIKDVVKGLDANDLSCWPYHVIPPLARYNSESGNMTLIGEGAHSMPISGGQEVAMAVEDAATLAHVLGHCNSGQLRKNLLGIWERHRMQRVEWVAIYSARTATYFQNVAPKGWAQMFKEWTMWACFWWLGEDGGMRWVYDYKTESVLPALIRV